MGLHDISDKVATARLYKLVQAALEKRGANWGIGPPLAKFSMTGPAGDELVTYLTFLGTGDNYPAMAETFMAGFEGWLGGGTLLWRQMPRAEKRRGVWSCNARAAQLKYKTREIVVRWPV